MADDSRTKTGTLGITDAMVERFRVAPGSKVRLERWPTRWEIPAGLEGLDRDDLKREAGEFVRRQAGDLATLQDVFWADGRYSLLLVFQGMDGSGKDSTIKHVTSGMNPAAVTVVSFKPPTPEELRHNYLWRYVRALPEQGKIGVFNRSYYEETVVVRVKPDLLGARPMPDRVIDDGFWQDRFEVINALEREMTQSGTVVLKFFLHISRDEQKGRLLERLRDRRKQWKFDPEDIANRELWDEYLRAYEAAISATSTTDAPWWIMPADRKWAMRALIAHVIGKTMKALPLRYPVIDAEKRELIERAIEELGAEKS
jgi:PPK2 family polyphosphate:nucleotide phosphotransferase